MPARRRDFSGRTASRGAWWEAAGMLCLAKSCDTCAKAFPSFHPEKPSKHHVPARSIVEDSMDSRSYPVHWLPCTSCRRPRVTLSFRPIHCGYAMPSAWLASPTHSLHTRTRGAERASSWSPLISTRKKCRPTPCRRTVRARTGGRPSLPRPVKARRPARAPASLLASRRPPPGPALPVRFWPPSCCCPRTITPRSSRFRNRPRWTLTPTPPRPMSPGPSRPSL